MRGNVRWKERFELALDARQVVLVLIGSLVILGGVFVLGLSVGRRASDAAQALQAPPDALARLDAPLGVRDEPAPELKAHQALTDSRSMDKSLPLPSAQPVAVAQPPLSVTPPQIGAASATAPVAAPGPAAGELHAQAPEKRGADPAAVPGPAAPSAAEIAVAAPQLPRAKPSPVPVKKADEKAAAAKGGSFTIQVASVSTRADAERLAKRHARRSPRVVAADLPGKGRMYRVQIGSFATREAAKRQLAVLVKSGITGVVTAIR